MHTVYLALGANVGDKRNNIKKCIGYLQSKFSDLICAPVYETKPWGYLEQDNFLNTVVVGRTDLSPQELLEFVKGIEKDLGRIKRFMNGPREIDIDILFYDSLFYKDNDLEIPHPRIEERDFVLRPLADLNPSFVHPVLHKSIDSLLKELGEETNIVRVISE